MNKQLETLRKYTKNLSVLYVEDEEIIRNETTNFLQHFFSDIGVAANGEIGLQKYKERNGFDLVITDIKMPKMNGIDLCRQIRQLDDEQPIIITSAHNDSEYLLKLIDIGVDKFIMKPMEHKVILQTLGTVTKMIWTKRKAHSLELAMHQKVEELNTMMNLVDHAIAVIDKGEVVDANERLLSLCQCETIQELQQEHFSLQSLLVEKEGFIYADTTHEILQQLEKNAYGKLLLHVHNKDRVYLTKTYHIPNSERYILLLTDYDEQHQKANIDLLTGLYSKNLLYECIKSDMKEDVAISLYVKNFDAIVKWHGIAAAFKLDQAVAKALREISEKNKHLFFKNIIYYERNRFLLLVTKENAHIIIETIENLRLMFYPKQENEDGITPPTSLTLIARSFSLPLHTTREEILEQIVVELENSHL
jgi:YesN/AraC family two-component response regulator